MSKSLLALLLSVASLAPLAAQPGFGVDLHDDPLPPGALARMGTLRLRTGGYVTAMALSPDGKTILTAEDNKVHLWDVATGRLTGEWPRIAASVGGLNFSRDGKTVVVAGNNGVVLLLDAATGQVRQSLGDEARGHGQLAATLSPDGRTLVTANRNDRQLLVWDVAGGRVRQRVPGVAIGPGLSPTVAFTPDSKQFVTVWSDGRIHLVDAETGKSVRPLESEAAKAAAQAAVGGRGGKMTSRRLAMALSPDGKTLVYRLSNERAFRVIDVASGKEVKRIERAERSSMVVSGMLMSPNGRFLYEAGSDSVIRVWGLASGKVMREFTTPAGRPQHLTISGDGKLVTATVGHVIHVWDVNTGESLHAAGGHMTIVTRLAFTPDADRLISLDNESVHVWETATGRELQSARTPGAYGQAPLSLSPDGSTVRWVGYDGVRYSLRIGVDREPARQNAMRRANYYSVREVSPDGRLLACIHDEDRKLRLVHLVEDKPDRELAIFTEEYGHTLAFSPDSRLLAVAAVDRSLLLFDVETGLEMRRLTPDRPGELGPCNLAFSRDSRSLLFYDGELRVIEVGSGGERVRFPSHPVLNAIQLSDDGRLAVRGGPDGEVIVYDGWTGREHVKYNGSQGVVYSLAISRDNRRIASGGANTTSLVWEAPPLPAPVKLAMDDETAWANLASPDAATAFRAMQHLAAQPEAAVRVIVENLKPKPLGDAKRAAKLVEELDSDAYAVRAKALVELEKLGRAAEEELRKAVKGPSLEVRRRAEELLAKLEEGPAASPARLRRLRAVEVLERIGGEKGRGALRKLLEVKPDAAFAAAIREVLARL